MPGDADLKFPYEDIATTADEGVSAQSRICAICVICGSEQRRLIWTTDFTDTTDEGVSVQSCICDICPICGSEQGVRIGPQISLIPQMKACQLSPVSVPSE